MTSRRALSYDKVTFRQGEGQPGCEAVSSLPGREDGAMEEVIR